MQKENMSINELEYYLLKRKKEAIRGMAGHHILGMKLIIQKNCKKIGQRSYEYDSLIAYESRKGKSILIRLDNSYDLNEAKKMLEEKIEKKEKYWWLHVRKEFCNSFDYLNSLTRTNNLMLYFDDPGCTPTSLDFENPIFLELQKRIDQEVGSGYCFCYKSRYCDSNISNEMKRIAEVFRQKIKCLGDYVKIFCEDKKDLCSCIFTDGDKKEWCLYLYFQDLQSKIAL
ncbi:hypothetical protein [Candidatus Uabimicrobium sp. HlEnr_7]|uniref:hypothetical protein n=1 Tax=Candidatus Uabimicrobium helgolandensis TaxID=3095367 RepID=UPI003556F4B4